VVGHHRSSQRYKERECGFQARLTKRLYEREPEASTDDDLLAECDVETFRASGRGGQHVNTTESSVRLRHRPTGVTTTSQAERSQHRNKQIALKNLRRKLEHISYRAPTRIPTRATKASKMRTLKEKSSRAQTKRLRAKPTADD